MSFYWDSHRGVVEAMLSISNNRYVIPFIINILLRIIGTFADMTPARLISSRPFSCSIQARLWA